MKTTLPLFIFCAFLAGCGSNDPGVKTETKKEASKSWIGTWERKSWENDAKLEIMGTRRDTIDFSLSAVSGGSMGDLEGIAIVTNGVGRFSDNGVVDSCFLQFTLMGDSVIVIDDIGSSCPAGIGVSYNGNYKNSKLLTGKIEKVEDLVTLGIFSTRQEDDAFRILVGKDYDLFVSTTQLVSEDEDLDSLHAVVRSAGVRGLYTFMENIIMTDSSGNIWAAVIDDQKVLYFTNNELYKNKLPKTIDNWRKNFKQYKIIYK
jgi:hypothetical protein